VSAAVRFKTANATAKTPRTPSFLLLKYAFLGDLGALAVQ
jgi:hypothetical protein